MLHFYVFTWLKVGGPSIVAAHEGQKVGGPPGPIASAAYACVYTWCWFVGDDDLTGALHVAAVVTTTSVTPIKCRMETFWYRLTQFYLENDC